jgi:nitrogen-specific signal transduction histidine kinase
MNSKKNKSVGTATNRSSSSHIGADFFVEFWEESWTYIKTVVDVLREPVLILDKECTVLAANEAFYTLFLTTPKETEGVTIARIGNGQWDIPVLRTLLKDILLKETSFKGLEVTHTFPVIGNRTIILNARHIYSKDKTTSELFPPIIMLAMEDVTSIMTMAKTLARHTNSLEKSLARKTKALESKMAALEKKMQSNTK